MYAIRSYYAAIVQLRDFLNENHYNVMVANNGESALELLNTVLPDAIVLDLMMPGIDGFQLLKTIREAEATINIPVLILTAKHVTKEELSMLKQNNIHQLIVITSYSIHYTKLYDL